MKEDIDDIKLGKELPDLVLVRKYYGTKGERKWELKTLDVDERQDGNERGAHEAEEEDMEEFMQELEGDKEMRANIKLYKKTKAQKVKVNIKQVKTSNKKNNKNAMETEEVDEVDDNDDEGWEDLDDEEVRLDELLDDLTVNMAAMDGSSNTAILCADEAAKVPAMKIESTGFEESNFDTSKFKFV